MPNIDSERQALTSAKTQREIVALKEQLASSERMLIETSSALKKLKQMRGAAAHKGAWRCEERMSATTGRIEYLRQAIAELEGRSSEVKP